MIGVYVPPDYHTKPSQRDVLEAVEKYRASIGKRSAVMVGSSVVAFAVGRMPMGSR